MSDQIEQDTAKPRAAINRNLVAELYFGTAEKTVQESSYDPKTMTKPYNPDDLFQRTGDYRLYEEMLVDDQVSVCMQIKRDMVIGSGWDIVCDNEDGDQQEIKEDIETALREDVSIPFEDMIEEITSAYEFGFSLTEKVFKVRDDGTLTLNVLKTRHPSTWLIHTDKQGNINKYEQRGRSSNIDVEPKSLIHYVNQRRFQNPYGTSDLRAAYNAYFVKRQIIRYYGIFIEKAASPIPVARYDKNAPTQAVTDIYNAIKQLQTKTALAIPKDIEMDFLEAKSTGEAYTKGIHIFNMFIGRALMIPDLLGFQGSETSGGAYSLGKEQLKVLFKHIHRRRSTLESLINKQVIEPIVVWNHGIVDHYPKFKFKEIDEDHLVELAKLWLELVKGKVVKPNEDEINHFRALTKFPEGEVEDVQQPVSNQDGINSESDQSNQAMPMMDSDKNNSDNTAKLPEKKTFGKGAYKLPKGNYHKKVDFSVIETHMDSFKNAVMTETYPVIKKIYQDLYDQIEKKKIVSEKKPDRIDGLKVHYLKEMKLILKKNLREAYLDSKKIAQTEILKGNYAAPTADEAFTTALETNTYQYLGDWEYEISKKTRIAIMEAINDGKPLSAVIDEIDSGAFGDSQTSIERYARTKFTEVTNEGRLAFFKESGVVAAYQYSAVLDDRTTDICSGLDGKIFDTGSEPVPPLHFNCRSLLIPITKYEDYDPDTTVGKMPIDQFINENKGDGFSRS